MNTPCFDTGALTGIGRATALALLKRVRASSSRSTHEPAKSGG